jgi:LPXTG-motif cell wall-anchored protein
MHLPNARRAVVAVSAGVGAALLVSNAFAQSYGGGAASPAAPAPATAGSSVAIVEKEYSLTPANVVAPGRTVRFTVTNNGTIEHNFTVELPDQGIEKTLFDTNLKPGETRTAEFTFTAPGRWEMYCPVDKHEDLGMKGVITVAGAAAPSQLPRTGGPSAGLPIAAALGALLVGGAVALGRRRHP